jgi:hypothetical protein
MLPPARFHASLHGMCARVGSNESGMSAIAAAERLQLSWIDPIADPEPLTLCEEILNVFVEK